MNRIILLGLALFISTNFSFSENLLLSELPEIPLPFADPLAIKPVVLDTDAVKPTPAQIAQLRPAAVIDTDGKIETNEIREIYTKNKNSLDDKNSDNLIEKVIDKEINETSEKSITNKDEENHIHEGREFYSTENITQNNNEHIENNEEDAIELDVGKENLFIPNTKIKEIPVEKINKPRPEIYNTMPKELHTNNIKYDIDEKFINSEFGAYKEYKKDTPANDIEYKLNPKLSVKNINSEKIIEVNKTEEPIVILKNENTEKTEDIKTEDMPKQFTAGEPTHNQIAPGRKVFRF